MILALINETPVTESLCSANKHDRERWHIKMPFKRLMITCFFNILEFKFYFLSCITRLRIMHRTRCIILLRGARVYEHPRVGTLLLKAR